MRKIMAYAARFGIMAAAGLLIGVGAVFALDQDSGPVADSVALLKSTGVSCGSCAGRIEQALKGKVGVASVEVDADGGLVTVAYDSRVAKPETLAETVTALGKQHPAGHERRSIQGKDRQAGSVTDSGKSCWLRLLQQEQKLKVKGENENE